MEKIYLIVGALMLCLFSYYSWSGATYFGAMTGSVFTPRGGVIYHK